MLILDPSLNFIETAESDVVEVYKSTFSLTMKQEDLPRQPCDSYICAVQDGPVILVYVALLLKYSKKTLIYVDGSRTDKLTDYHESLNEALTFLTSMGFTMENVNLNYSDALKSAILRGIRVLRPVSAARLAAKQKSGAEKGRLNKAEAELIATKKAASKKTETERLAVEEAARERAEKDRQAAEKAARERAEQERQTTEETAREWAEQARRAAGYAAEEREEAERIAEETAALVNERIEQADAERYATEEAIRKFTKAEKIAAENAKAEKISVEEIRANRIAAEKGIVQKAEAERLAAEKATKARQEEEAATAERLAAEKLVREKIATEKIASAKSAKEHAAAEKIKKEWIAAEEAAAQIAEEEKNAAEKYADAQKAEETATAARQAAEDLLRDKTDLLKIVRERSEAEIAAARQMVLGKIAAEKAAAEKAVEALAVLKVMPAAEDDSETTGPEHGPTKQAAREDGAERLAAEIAAGEKAGVENEAAENADRSATEANDEAELLSALKRVKERLKADTNVAAKGAECLAAAKKLKTGKTVEELAEALRIAADMAAAEEAAEELRAKGIILPPPSAVTIPVLAAEPAVAQAIVQTTPPATASQEFAPSSAVNDDLDPFSFMGGRQETGGWQSNNDGQSSGSGTVFLMDTSRKWLEYTSEEDIIALQKSINVARAALEGNVTQSCKGYICLINEGGNSHVYLAISLSSGDKVLIYAPDKQPASPEECTMVTNDGIHFLELIGFMMDSVKLDGDQETRTAEISKMPFLHRLTPET
jgi:hypothetical protein